MEKSSTDKRIDDLAGRAGRFENDVAHRFDRVEGRFQRFEDKVDERFKQVDARFDRVDERFEQMVTKEEFKNASEVQTMRFEFLAARIDGIDARFDRWGKLVTGGVVAIVAAVIGKVLGV